MISNRLLYPLFPTPTPLWYLQQAITEVENMLDEVKELESQKLNVRWLRERIEHLINKKRDFVKYSIVKEEQSICKTNIKRLEKEVSLLQQQLEAEKVKLKSEVD